MGTTHKKMFGQNPIGLCENLRQLIQLEKGLNETEDGIIRCLNQMPIKIYNLNAQQGQIPLEYAGNILIELEKAVDCVTYIISIWKHSKRCETPWKWPECSKIENWTDSILSYSSILWDRVKYLHDMHCQVDRQNGTYDGNSPFQILKNRTEQLISRILNATFFLEEHPPTFVKEKSYLTLKFRHLMGKHIFLAPTVPPTISLLNNKEVDSILANKSDYFRAELHASQAGVLGVTNADVKQNGQLTIDFAKFQVLKPLRVKPSESVKDDKFCFLCEMVVCLRPELKLKVWTLSEPLTCGTHGSQKTRSLGTIVWDNAASVPNRTTLAAPSEVAWSTLEPALDRIHMSIANIPLSEDNKKHLRARLIQDDSKMDLVTFRAFCVDNLPGLQFTFWEWFFDGLKFGETYFKKLWTDGYVMGFLGRDVAQQFLSQCLPGTFLIRFSESVGTAITISFKCADGIVYSAGPFTKDVLEWKRLGEIIYELQEKPLFLKQFYTNKFIPNLETLIDSQPAPSKSKDFPVYVHCWKRLVPGL